VNWGRWSALEDVVLPRVEALAQDSGGKVSLIGASMGGLYARELARSRPDLVRCVITLASAVLPTERSNYVWPVYEAVTHQPEDSMHVPAPLPVPCTSVFSRTDGLSNWRPCVQSPGVAQENVGIVSSHTGMMCHPATLYLLADRLAQPDADWRPFLPPPLLRGFYETDVAA
jgi:pimeloyl-ACP methyl ester carboxylesterase